MTTLPKYIVLEFLKLYIMKARYMKFDIGVAPIYLKMLIIFLFSSAPATGTSGTDVLTVEGDIEVM
jgi:hypothetical protein